MRKTRSSRSISSDIAWFSASRKVTVAISVLLAVRVDVAVEVGGVGHRALLRELVSVLHLGLDFLRQLPEAGERERFVERALVRRAVAEEAEGDAVLAAVLRRERGAGGERHVAADDRVAAEEADARVEEVHGAAAPLRAARHLAVEL